jgi:hypothetical protein
MIENEKLSHWLTRLSLKQQGQLRMKMDAINKQRQITLMLLTDYRDELTPDIFQLLNVHLKAMDVRELKCSTDEALKDIRNNDNLTAKDRIRLTKDIRDEHQVKMKALQVNQSISTDTAFDSLLMDNILHRENSDNNSETTVRIEPINREDNERIEDKIQREYNENTEQEQQKTLWSDGVHIPGIHPPRPKLKPRVYFANESFVTNQNLSVILASPGTGKSSICESILASVLNKDCDTLSFKVDEDVQRAIYFDTERDLSMIDRSNERMLQRANVSEHLENALVVGLRENFSVKDKKEKIIQVIEHYKPQLILIDGVSDLMSNTNSEEETNLIIEWLNKIITHYNLSLITTLHPNKGTDTARGWIGSEMLRKCEGVILVKENVDEIRTMSVTKARDSAKPKASFKWCNDNLRMMSCEHNTKVGAIKKLNVIDALTNNELEQLKKSIGFEDMKYNEIATALQQYLKEEHPGVATGNNAIGVFIKDLSVNEVHLFKQGKAPKTTYKLRLVGAI